MEHFRVYYSKQVSSLQTIEDSKNNFNITNFQILTEKNIIGRIFFQFLKLRLNNDIRFKQNLFFSSIYKIYQMSSISENSFRLSQVQKKARSLSKKSENQSVKSEKFVINLLCPPKINPDEIRSNRSQMKKRISLSIPKSKTFIFCKDQKQMNKTASSEKDISDSEDKIEIKFFTEKKIILQQNQSDCIKINFIDFQKEVSFMKEETFDSKYQLMDKIGEGAHSSVYRCRHILSDQFYAVKITRKVDEELKNRMVKQYKLLKVLDHPNVLKVYQLFFDQSQQQIYIISQLCEYQDLRQQICLKKQKNQQFSKQQIDFLFLQILRTVDYLHSSGISHRDLKPQNILYNSNTKQLKIIDFDISKQKYFKKQEFFMWTNTGTLHYRAPETFNFGYNQKVDLWSLGIIIYQLLTGQIPFSSSSEKQTIKKIKTQNIQFSNIKCEGRIKYLLQRMLQKQSLHRISSRQCLSIFQEYKTNKPKDDMVLYQRKKEQLRQQMLSILHQENNQLLESTQGSLEKICATFRIKIQFVNWNIFGAS